MYMVGCTRRYFYFEYLKTYQPKCHQLPQSHYAGRGINLRLYHLSLEMATISSKHFNEKIINNLITLSLY